MRNVIFGAIGVLWGGGMLVYALVGGGSRASGAYGAGQSAAPVFGLLLFVVGLYYLIKGVRGGRPDEPRQRPRKPKRQPADGEGDD